MKKKKEKKNQGRLWREVWKLNSVRKASSVSRLKSFFAKQYREQIVVDYQYVRKDIWKLASDHMEKSVTKDMKLGFLKALGNPEMLWARVETLHFHCWTKTNNSNLTEEFTICFYKKGEAISG